MDMPLTTLLSVWMPINCGSVPKWQNYPQPCGVKRHCNAAHDFPSKYSCSTLMR
nr:MAG TPA: hypothetical protein [Caudoviricetes sp.]